MAIVRTTTSPGEVPDPKKPTPSKSVAKSIARPATGRALAPSRGQAPKGLLESLKDTYAELHRVVWPTRDTVQSGAIVTIGLLIFFGFYIYGLDRAIEWVFRAIGMYPEVGS